MTARPRKSAAVPEHDVLTAQELQKLLRVGRNTVYRMAELGKIPGTIRLGRVLRFSRSAVRSWLGQSTPSEEDR